MRFPYARASQGRAFCFTALIWIVVFAPATLRAAAWSAEDRTAADALMTRFVSENPPTATVCITVHGRIVYSKGFGASASEPPPPPDTIYQIGSVTKQFVAAAILALIEDGAVMRSGRRFSLEADMPSFFAGVEHWSTSARPMTVRRLLNMQSNLPNYTSFPPRQLSPGGPVSSAELLAAIKKFKLQETPAELGYSNTNYFLLAQIIANLAPASASGSSTYRDYLERRIFQRAGMRATGFIDAPAPGHPVAPSGLPAATGLNWSMPKFHRMDWPEGAGDVSTNAIDMCIWNTALLGGRVLSASGVQTLLTPVAPWPPAPGAERTSYAMGWLVNEFDAVTEYAHGGAISGFAAANLIARHQNGNTASVSVLTNTSGRAPLYRLVSALGKLASQ
jgi:CubicO group peptidase (beta-lactamase class C family)